MKSLLLTLCAMLCVASAATAADFTVINTANSGPGSLSQAILGANALPGLDRIVFNIPGAGPHLIEVYPDALPSVSGPVILDGYTQPGAAPNSLPDGGNAVIKIQLDGAYEKGGTVEYGLVLSGGGSIVRGLSITGFHTISDIGPFSGGGAAIRIVLEGGNTIEGNFLGLKPDGTSIRENHIGVHVGSNGNTIGGPSPAARNVISGNSFGVVLFAPNGNKVAGNFIGTDRTGNESRGKWNGILDAAGIFVVSEDHEETTIGGTEPGTANVISGNYGSGIKLGVQAGLQGQYDIQANNVVIQGNLIGTKANGVDLLSNTGDGINIFGSQNLVGGLEPGAANIIAHNNGAGVAVVSGPSQFSSTGNRVLSNIMYSSGWGGIDLGRDGLAANDLGDTDTGPNNSQNFPVFTAVDPPAANGDVTIHGELNSAPSSNFLLQFFFQKFPTPSRLLGSVSVTTTAGGRGRFTFVAQGLGSTTNGYLFASATDVAGNTSEFGGHFGSVQMANISTRAEIGTGDDILIGGFVIHSSQPAKKVIVRALGPSLNVPNRLADPYLELYDEHGTLLAKNDDWRSAQQEVMGSGIPPSSDLESAIVASLKNGGYTAQMRDVNGKTGIGVIEIYDLDPFPNQFDFRLANLSTRGLVGTNDNVLIGGMIVRGNAAQRLIIRAIGPDLIAVGLPGALPDPTLELRDESGTLLASNDNWRSSQEQEIKDTQLAPNDDRDSAIVVPLAPGSYTAIVRGKQNETGLGIVEFYLLPTISFTASDAEASGGQ